MSIVTVTFVIIALIAAIVGTIFAYMFIMPKENEDSDNKYIKFLHGLFHFKKLYIEDITKGLYIFSSLSSILCGVAYVICGLLSIFFQNYMAMPRIGIGLGLIIICPILLRVAYEFIMMIVLLVRNVIEINSKMKKD